jgi:hypothetical protein
MADAKAKPTMVPFELLLVEWRDHHSSHEWLSKQSVLEDCKPERCLSVGWLYKETDDSIVLVSCCDPSDPDKGDVGGIWTILKTCIVTRHTLKNGKRRKK